MPSVVEDIGDAFGDVLGGAVDLLEDAADFVVDEIVSPVLDTVGDVIESALDNPLKTVAQIYAIVTPGMQWALPLIEGADVAIKGGDLGDVLEATAKAYVAQEIGQAAGKYAYKGTSTAAAGAAYGTSGQQAAMLAAQEAGMKTASDIAGQLVGGASASAAAGIVYGRDPIESFTKGLLTAGSAQLVGATLGAIDEQTGGNFAKLRRDSPTAAAVIESSVAAQVTGQNVTAAVISSAIRTSGIATDIMAEFVKDNKNVTPAQIALGADIITNLTATAFAGGDPSRAVQATLMKVGAKALGDLAKEEFKGVINNLQEKNTFMQRGATALEKNVETQKELAEKYNETVAELNARVKKQDEMGKNAAKVVEAAQALIDGYNKNPKLYDRKQVEEYAEFANKAVEDYNKYVKELAKDYDETYKPTLDGYEKRLADLPEQYDAIVEWTQEQQEELIKVTDDLDIKLQGLYSETAEAFVSVMDPNFNVSEYKKINGLDSLTNAQAYEHWLNDGQFEGLKTNNTDVSVAESIEKYTNVFGEPPPVEKIASLIESTNADRDDLIAKFVDYSVKDKEARDNYTNSVANKILDAYRDEGLNDSQVNAKIDSGEAKNYINQTLENANNNIAQLRKYTADVGEKFGTDSAEYKDAYLKTLDAMAEVGGYGVFKENNDYIIRDAGKLDKDTLTVEDKYIPSGASYRDPVTGGLYMEIFLGSDKTPEKNYSALFAVGKSAKPPSDGGYSVFFDGSGVDPGLFGVGLAPLAVDSGTGASLYGGSNGFALIAYSDGKGAAIDTKTMEVIFVEPEKVKEILDKTPVTELEAPKAANPEAEPPAPITIETPTNPAITSIKEKIQSPEDVKKAFDEFGYQPTVDETKQFAGEKPADTLTNELKSYVDPRQVTREEAEQFFKDQGYQPTKEEVDQFVKQGATVNQEAVQKEVSDYVDPRQVTEEEIRDLAKLENISIEDAEIAQYIGQRDEASTIATAREAFSPRGTTRKEAENFFRDVYGYPPTEAELDLFFRENFAEDAAREEIGTYVDPRQVTRTEAEQFFRDLGYTPTEQEIEQFIRQGADILQTGVQTELGEYVDPRQVTEEEVYKAFEDLGFRDLRPEDAATLIGQYEEQLLADRASGKLNEFQYNAIQVNINELKAKLGDPYRAVTQEDVDFVGNLIAEQTAEPSTQLTREQLAYDANQDGKVDQSDLDLLQGVLGGTGDQPFTPGAGSVWGQGGTGIYGALAGQERAAQEREASARAQALQLAQQTQQRGNVNQLLQMLGSAQDIGGQQVTVKAPDPARIGYVYDIAGPSIFATPQQQQMFVTPYSPFAQGGMVEDDVTAELLRIIRS